MIHRSDKKNLVAYRKPLNLNIGMIIFGVIFLYIIICIVMYMKTDHLSGYEVKRGSLSINNVYRGIALRKEEVYHTDSAGYVYYFTAEGVHLACSDPVFALDSSGSMTSVMESTGDLSEYSGDDLKGVKQKIISFRNNFTETEFSSVYDFRTEVQNELTKLSTSAALQDLNQISSGIQKFHADRAGTVALYVDGYESLTPETVTESSFDEEAYEKKQRNTNDLLGNNDMVYKLISSEDWSVVIRVDTERAAQLSETGYVKVRFMDDQYETWGKVNVLGLTDDEKNNFVSLSFTTAMANYISARFLDIELILEEEDGLKIPNSAIVEKKFYLINSKFIFKGGPNGKEGVMRRTFMENNEMTTEFVETPIYNIEDDTYYVDEQVLQPGDIIYSEDSTETYTVSEQASLIGVYNINKGYADFKQINILYQNEKYSIIESNTQYGLNVYDYIALDAQTLEDEQFLYE